MTGYLKLPRPNLDESLTDRQSDMIPTLNCIDGETLTYEYLGQTLRQHMPLRC